MEQLRLSPSRVNDFLNCPQHYYFRAILALPEPPSIEAERGKLVHSVLEELFKLPREDRTFDAALERLPQQWQLALEENVTLSNLVTDEKEWLDRAISLLATYFQLENPQKFESTHQELHLEKDFREGVYLHGYVDRVDVAPSGEVRIVDYKTGKSPKPGWEEKALFQLRIYALLYWRLNGVIPHQLKLLYLGNQEQIISQPREDVLLATEKKLHKIADEILTAIDTNHFPAQKSKLCDWCNFKDRCPAFN